MITDNLKKIKEVIESEWTKNIDEKYIGIAKKCIVIEPNKRTSLREISEELNIDIETYKCKETILTGKFKKYTNEDWLKLKEKFFNYVVNKNISSYTKSLALKYMKCYLQKHSLKKIYENLLMKSAYYLAVRINETRLPPMNNIFENEYSLKDINDMDNCIIKICDGNLLDVWRTPWLKLFFYKKTNKQKKTK